MAQVWTLIILSQIFVSLAVRIKRKRFGFNRTRLSYFNEKPTTPLHHWSKNVKKHMFQWKNLFVSSFLLRWKLLKHFWKQKKMWKTNKCNIYDDERSKFLRIELAFWLNYIYDIINVTLVVICTCFTESE